MKKLYVASYLIAAVLTTQVASAQATNNPQTRSGSRENTRVNEKDQSQIGSLSSINTAEYVRSLAESISLMQDPVTGYQLARIGDLLWEKDQEYVRELFLKSLRKVEIKSDDTAATIKLKTTLYTRTLSVIAKRDAAWAKQIIDSTPLETKAEESCAISDTNLDVARNLSEADPKLAENFASRSLQKGISLNFLGFLQELRQKDSNAADRLFLQLLAAYSRQPASDAPEIAILGTYLFTSPNLNTSDNTGYTLTRFGNVGVPDLTADRQGIQPVLVRTYLKTALAVMLLPSTDVQQQQSKYALGRLLLPKAQKFAPDLMAEINVALGIVASSISSDLTREEAFDNFRKSSSPNPIKRLEDIEKMPEHRARDLNYLDLAYHSWLKGDLARAKESTAKISEEKVSGDLRILMSFGDAKALLKQKKPNLIEAGQIANQLPQSVERAVLQLEVALAAIKAGNNELAYEHIYAAAKSARQITDARKPYLLLAVGANLAKLDPAQSTSLLNEAVQAFNRSKNFGAVSVEWEREVSLEQLNLRFPLLVNANLDFENLIKDATVVLEPTTPFEALKSELLKAKAYVVLAKFALASEKESTSQDEGVYSVGEDGIRKSARTTVLPVYPEQSRKKKTKGVAIIELQYDETGDVTQTKILEAPDDAIGQSVVDAVKQWKFNQSKGNGKTVNGRGKLTFYFVIDENGKGTVKNSQQYQ